MNKFNSPTMSAVNDEEEIEIEGTEEIEEAPRKSKKKAAKKVAPKKAAKKVVAKAEKAEVEPIKAESISEAIGKARKAGLKRGMFHIKGKKYSFSIRKTWAIVKTLLDAAIDGHVMYIEDEGFYVYPKNKFKEVFENIFKSGTWKSIGIYSQSTLPQWHNDFFTKKK
jgi:hypothetical protein